MFGEDGEKLFVVQLVDQESSGLTMLDDPELPADTGFVLSAPVLITTH